jgi:TRAP transporter 4TM/12TM fusion protein
MTSQTSAEGQAGSRRVGPPWRLLTVAFTVAGLVLVITQVFFWNPFGGSLLRNEFLYLVMAIFLSLVFVVFRARKHHGDEGTGGGESSEGMAGMAWRVPWYDALLFAASIGINGYFAYNAENITNLGWDYTAPTVAVALSFALWGIVLEALRRTAGLAVTLVAALFSAYPLFAGRVPVSFLQGIEFDARGTARMHVMGVDSILGLPLQTAAGMLVGFLFFGVALQHTGGSKFFFHLAQSLFGQTRGGSAKVAVVSSASMGMMSGSAVSNVLTTGPMTIPAMKKAGYPGRYAAGIEATASSGGSVTPPIMGAAAFLMVSFLGVPYREVALAAAIPAILYYLGIFTQVDAYAAKARLRGAPRASLPRLGPVLLEGWPYVLALVGLVVLLMVHKNEAQAPFFVVAALVAIAMVRRQHRLTGRGVVDLLADSGKTIAEIVGIIAGVGLIVGGLSMSGVSLSLARELVVAVGDNVILILIAGAITCFILGMGMTVSAVYVFLAIVMAPALIELGVNPIAAHLFVIYWAAVSYITPPVALAAFAAAGIARTPPMQTGFTAMRLGMVKYVIPFLFALNPALVAQAPLGEVAFSFVMAVLGVALMGASFEGWVPLLERPLGWVARVVGFAAGFAMLAPEAVSSLAGLAVAAVLLLVVRLRNRDAAGPPPPPDSEPETSAEDPTPGRVPPAVAVHRAERSAALGAAR